MRLIRIMWIAVCLGGLACSSTGGKSKNSNTNRPKDRPTEPAPFWSENGGGRGTGFSGEAPPPSSEFSGILAGTVLDASDRPVAGAVVNFSEAEAPPASAAPKGIETDAQGTFKIMGLKPGSTYLLTFRAEENGRTLGSSAQTKPPNVHMLVRVTPAGVSSITPPAPVAAPPGGASPPASKDAAKDPPQPIKISPPLEPVVPVRDPILDGDGSFAPGKTPPASRSFPPPPTTRPAPNNINIAADPSNPPLPTINIPNTAMPPPRNVESPPTDSSSMSAEPARYTPNTPAIPALEAPSSRGKTRIDFTLYDLSGRPWSFRNHTGKLILLDFWSTTCLPCLNAIPKMVDLQSRYGPDGLEVIGVTCEEPTIRFTDQVAAVERVKVKFSESRYPINYRLYLEGSNFEGRVQKLFRVDRYPTMVLLSDSGQELWRSDRKDATRLEDAIKYYMPR